MLRSMYSGVSGMKAHQSKMDVIGNNIANVNTYGYKSSRTTFSEVYYQTVRSASAASVTRGGMNASQIGYGVSVASIDVQHTRSGFQMTDNGMDLAIAGEGFFQVQDSDGNAFYTRAGMIRIDSSGNLVDQNGNFVLGVNGNPLGKAASNERIQMIVPSLQPSSASVKEIINGITYSITSGNQTRSANVNIDFSSSDTLPLGQKMVAELSSYGISIMLNDNESFDSIQQFNEMLNLAITEANGGKPHPGGDFVLAVEGNANLSWPLTGKNITSTNFEPVLGKVIVPNELSALGFSFDSVSSGFSGSSDISYQVTHQTSPSGFLVSAVIGGNTYTGLIPSTVMNAGKIKLGSGNDAIVLNHPGFNALTTKKSDMNIADGDDFFAAGVLTVDGATPSSASLSLGLSAKTLTLNGGSLGGVQSVSDLINIGVGSDGVISGIHSQLGLIALGRIDLAMFENPQGLTQSGNSYFTVSANSGNAKFTNSGIGGAGGIQAGALEMSNVDLSKEFADMITTQRGFQASSRLITVSDEILNELVNLKR